MPPKVRAVAEVPLEDFNESHNWMIHAYPGAGKTRLGATAPNSIFWSAEPGVISAARAGRGKGIQGVVKTPDWETLLDATDAAERGDYAHRDWIVTDTISTMQEKGARAVLEKAVRQNPNRDPDIPAIQDYQKAQNQFKRWFERMIDLPQNVLFLAHTMRVDDQDGGALIMPSIEGQEGKGWRVANYCMGLVNLIGYMERKTVPDPERDGKTKQVIRTLWQPYHDPDKEIRYIAKDHFGALGFYSDNLTMPEIIAKVDASGTQEEEPPPAAKKATRPARRAS
jgi:hypothetical protein